MNIYICILYYIYIYVHIYTTYIYNNTFFVLCYLPKLKKGMELVFSAYFLYTLSIKMLLTKYIPYQLTKF